MIDNIMDNDAILRKRRMVVVSINLLIAAAHIIRPGSYLHGGAYILYYSFFSDLALPFGYYFLLRMVEPKVPVLRRWEAKAAVSILLPSIAETCQYFGIPVLGSTFDPLDYLMYAVGAFAAALLDRLVFSRVFDFWSAGEAEEGR